MIVVIDYDLGNSRSIINMLKKIGAQSVLSSDLDEIARADKLILPGVGAFGSGMQNLRELGLISVLDDMVLEKKTPVLGICLGMQLFTARSEEGNFDGLGWLDAETVRFRVDEIAQDAKLPHMGWNTVHPRKENALLDGLQDNPRFYFVHTYHLRCHDPNDILCETNYHYDFTSAIAHRNILGTQFHPEKSHRFGIQLLRNFVQHA